MYSEVKSQTSATCVYILSIKGWFYSGIYVTTLCHANEALSKFVFDHSLWCKPCLLYTELDNKVWTMFKWCSCTLWWRDVWWSEHWKITEFFVISELHWKSPTISLFSPSRFTFSAIKRYWTHTTYQAKNVIRRMWPWCKSSYACFNFERISSSQKIYLDIAPEATYAASECFIPVNNDPESQNCNDHVYMNNLYSNEI